MRKLKKFDKKIEQTGGEEFSSKFYLNDLLTFRELRFFFIFYI